MNPISSSLDLKSLSRALAMAGISCQSESELIARIKDILPGCWDDDGSAGWWRSNGEKEGMSAVAGAQQKCKEAAAKEIVANALDALLSDALTKLPKGTKIPNSNKKAWQLLKKHGLMPTYGDVVAFVQGNPKDDYGSSFGIMDRGCGQRPENMLDTFLSLLAGEKNKMGKGHLMGRYGMGSSGVHNFAGVHGIKMILTRTAEDDCPWSVTLVRFKPKAKNILQYLVFNGAIPVFDAEPIMPLVDAQGDAWDGYASEPDFGVLTHGSFVKMFSFEPIKMGAASFAALKSMIDQRFTELPFDIACFSNLLGGHYTTRRDANGKFEENRADVAKARGCIGWATEAAAAKGLTIESVELAIRIDTIDHESEAAIHIHLLPESLGEIDKRFGKACGFYALSGQVHHVETSHWLSSMNLGALAGRVLVEIEASGLSEATCGRIFSADRESINDSPIGRGFKAQAAKAIESDPTVMQWASDERVRQQAKALAARADGFDEVFDQVGGFARKQTLSAQGAQRQAARADARLAMTGEHEALGAMTGYCGLRDGFEQAKRKASGTVAGQPTASTTGMSGAKKLPKGHPNKPAIGASKVKALPPGKVRIKNARKVGTHATPTHLNVSDFHIVSTKIKLGEATFAIEMRAGADYAQIEGSTVIFDLEVGEGASAIRVDGLTTVWASQAEIDELDADTIATRARRGAADAFTVTYGTKDGRHLDDGKPSRKLGSDFFAVAYEPRVCDGRLEVILNIDHPQAITQAGLGDLKNFQNEIVKTAYSNFLALLGSKKDVGNISPLFNEGRKIEGIDAQIEALLPHMAQQAICAETNALAHMAPAPRTKGARS